MADSIVPIQQYARYDISAQVLDTLPLRTFLIGARRYQLGGGPETVMQLIKPAEGGRYSAINLSPGGNLLYYFWSAAKGAQTKLGQASLSKNWRWIVQPGEEGFELLDAFKIACHHRRGQMVSTVLLYRALGFDTTSEPANIIAQ